FVFFFSSRRRHTRFSRDWSSDVCSSDLAEAVKGADVVMILLPDENIAEVYRNQVEPNIKAGAALAFAHGFNVHYGQVVPRKDIRSEESRVGKPGGIRR